MYIYPIFDKLFNIETTKLQLCISTIITVNVYVTAVLFFKFYFIYQHNIAKFFQSIFFFNRRLRKQRRYKIVFNLALMLLSANLLILLGLDKSQNYIVCCLIAGLLQYTLLAAFNWMLAQVQYFDSQINVVLTFNTIRHTRWSILLIPYT